jgi:cyclic pyranopterin phosphate synthase
MLRDGVDDATLADAVRAIWTGRSDRYSELRSLDTVDLPKVEMSYIGG